MRKILVLLLALTITPTATFAGPLKAQLKEAKQAHAHKKQMKKAVHKDRKAQKEHKLLQHGKKGG